MKRMLTLLLLGAASLTFNAQVLAHGNTKPQHGGIVQMVGETVFELVALADGIELYIVDDAEELPSAEMTGKLTITSDGVKSEAVLQPAGGNKLEAKGVKIPPGAKVAVLLIRKDDSKLGANFTIK